jgi:hypothetical protein
MRKFYVLAVILVFAGVTAFSLNIIQNERDTDPRKSACATVAQSECSEVKAVAVKAPASDCTRAVNAVLTSGSEKSASSCGSSSAEAVKASAGDCSQAVKTSVTAEAKKESACCSSATSVKQAAVSKECSGEKTRETTIAENQ